MVVSVPDVWKSTTTVPGELCAMTTSTTLLRLLHATVSASGEEDLLRFNFLPESACRDANSQQLCVDDSEKHGTRKNYDF